MQRVRQVAVIADVNADGTERYLARISVRASLANFLIGKTAAQNLGQGLFVTQSFEGVLHSLLETDKEFVSVLLLPKVHRFAVHPEMLPEATRHIQLKFGICQMTKNGLNLL